MLRLASVCGLALVAASLVAASGSSAPASLTAVRIIDRTMSCSVPLQSGARPIVVSAVRGFRDPDRPGEWKWQPKVELDMPPLVWLRAGADPDGSPGALAIDPARCRTTAARVAFSSRGLSGGIASQLPGSRLAGADSYKCNVGGRVLVRIRAVFRRPTELNLRLRAYRRSYLVSRAGGVMTEGKLAVRTPGGKRVIYSDVVESGRARLFAASGCRDHD